ncbi:hypothetical protein AG1IA_06461 [Rhizoctonia solani AG-1 IA]|uniref:Uncharacterized protein n=1 Tax=Thanatephorus cucumeris (strain AG1-IA) TaxID=983506 RepID=L8WMX6_THACA|nr:hypothetical protein AG1IA_06461 [Rhizoctonia solani AG-1 IA]
MYGIGESILHRPCATSCRGIAVQRKVEQLIDIFPPTPCQPNPQKGAIYISTLRRQCIGISVRRKVENPALCCSWGIYTGCLDRSELPAPIYEGGEFKFNSGYLALPDLNASLCYFSRASSLDVYPDFSKFYSQKSHALETGETDDHENLGQQGEIGKAYRQHP